MTGQRPDGPARGPQPGPAASSADDSQPAATPDTPSAAAPVDQPLGGMTFRTVAEVAQSMRVSKMTVYRLVHAGTLPAVQVGRSFRIPASAVTDYLEHSYVRAG